MAATWTIVDTKYDIVGSKGDNQITTLHWQCTEKRTVEGVDHYGTVNGSIVIPEPSGTFIEYAKVTETNCITWCKAIMGDDQVKEIEDKVQKQINLSITPVTGTGKPW